MGRYVCGVFTPGRREPGEMPAAFDEASDALGARWGHSDGKGIVRIEVEPQLVVVKPAPRWLGFAHLGDLREICRVITWAVGVAYDRQSPVLFVPDEGIMSDDPPETFEYLLGRLQEDGPSADPLWWSEFAHLFGRNTEDWSLDALTDIDAADPMASYRAIVDGFRARGGMRMRNGPYASATRSPEELAAGGELRVHARAEGATKDAPTWSGLLEANVDGKVFYQFRDVYTGNTLGADPIEAAIEHACTLRNANVILELRGRDVCSGEIVVTDAQVRRLAQVGASLDATVYLSGSD